MSKRILALTLAIFMTFGMFTFSASAAPKVGDKIGDVLYTDIVGKINGHPIPTSNVKGNTMVCVEDLARYGFDVKWDATAKTLKVEVKPGKAFNPIPVQPNTGTVGSVKGSILYTNIKTYLSGKEVESYNIGGFTVIQIDQLGMKGVGKYGDVVWNGAKREINLTISGGANTNNAGAAGQTPPPGNGKNPLVGVWEGSQEGVPVRYEFTSDGNMIMSSSSGGNTSASEFPYIIISENKFTMALFGEVVYNITGNTLSLTFAYNGVTVKLTRADKNEKADAGAKNDVVATEEKSNVTLAMIEKAAKDSGYKTEKITYFSPLNFEKEFTPVAGIYVTYEKDYSSGATAAGTSGDVGIYEFKDKAAADAYVKNHGTKYNPLQNGKFVAMLYKSDMFPTHNADIKAVFEKILQGKTK